MLQDTVEDAACGGVGVLARTRLGVVGDHLGAVRVAAADHGDVEVLPSRGRLDEHVRGVGGDAWGAIGGDRVAEVGQTHSPVIVRVCAVTVYRQLSTRHSLRLPGSLSCSVALSCRPA